MDCRVCKGEFKEILDLGNIYLSTFVESLDIEGTLAPLKLVECVDCGLVQLEENLELDEMYRQYWYRSNLNNSMVVALEDIVTKINSKIVLEDNDIVIDIGANDGTLLSFYSDSIYKIGIDPAFNLEDSAEKNCDLFINDFFTANNTALHNIKAKVITAIAMFYDLPDPNKFINDVKNLLHKNGIFVIQLTDLTSLLEINAFDSICHEHLEYYSMKWLVKFFKAHGLEVFDAEYNKVNGRSLRLYIAFPDVYKVTETVDIFLDKEEYFYHTYGELSNLQEEIDLIVHKLRKWLKQCNIINKKVAVLGASTKGNTLLQVLGDVCSYIDHAAEINKDKFGLYTVGTNIPIISQVESLKKNPYAYLVLPFHFKDFFIKKFDSYLRDGGILVFPLPRPHAIYYSEGNYILVKDML